MANWKIQDIAPPKKQHRETREVASREEPRKRVVRRRRRVPGWVLKGVVPILVLVVVLVGGIHIFFTKAEVSLWPETRQIKLLEPIVAAVGQEELDQERGIIPARTLQEEQKATRLFEASSTTVKENRAQGTIRVFNAYTTSPYTLIAKTRFVSEDGKLFRTPVRITIPGMSGDTPGFIDIEVVAAEAGEDYNIEPSSFSVPGLSGSPAFTAIYAESLQSITGGSERQVSVVSEDDIENGKESLIEELTQNATQELLGRVPEHMMATKDSILVEVTEADSLVEPGAELDQFNVSVSLTATAYLFSRDDLNALVDSFLAAELEEREQIAEDKTEIRFEQIALQKNESKVSLELGVVAVAYLHVDPTELKIKLRGKSKDEAESILASVGAFSETNLSLWPFWVSSIPGNVDKLEIRLFID